MKLLIAEDDFTSRRLLEVSLAKWSYQFISTKNGLEALKILHSDDPPQIAILDWMMPEIDGVELCRMIRQDDRLKRMYIILLTTLRDRQDIVAGLEAGADDYVVKPFDKDDLLARIRVGERVIRLQVELRNRVIELQDALTKVQTLQGLIPICANCKKIRSDGDYWMQVEEYIEQHSEAEFSHGICPDCLKELYPEIYKKMHIQKHTSETEGKSDNQP